MRKKKCQLLFLHWGKALQVRHWGISRRKATELTARRASLISSHQHWGSHFTVRGTAPGNIYSLKARTSYPSGPRISAQHVLHLVKSAASLTCSDVGCHLFPVSVWTLMDSCKHSPMQRDTLHFTYWGPWLTETNTLAPLFLFNNIYFKRKKKSKAEKELGIVHFPPTVTVKSYKTTTTTQYANNNSNKMTRMKGWAGCPSC